jgi:endoglucanase
VEGGKALFTLNLDQPIPERYAGDAWFQIELFPATLFGKSWNMDGQTGIFPTDAYGPINENEIVPYAEGSTLTVAPETHTQRLTIKSIKGGALQLTDGRMRSKSGWFIVRSAVPENITAGAVQWEVEVFPVKNYTDSPVIHLSQVGYLPDEPKKAVIELDPRTDQTGKVSIYKINPDGSRSMAFSGDAKLWGKFLRYQYAIGDFSSLKEPGMYQVQYGEVYSNLFRIADDIYDRFVWQPTLEYFLPVQMCHVRVEQGSRVWHDWCHLDDALMAPLNHVHFDGYSQGPESFTHFVHPQHVPDIDRGGWHDAGDYDLRVESQAVTTWRLALMYELFDIDLDVTRVEQDKRLVTIHDPDGIPDALQQVEHGVLTVLGGYRGLGRLYDGIIASTGKQYGLQGDGGAMTDNLVYNPSLGENARTASQSGIKDDRWVFTEDNARHEMIGVAGLASASRVLKEYQPELARECLDAASNLYAISSRKEMVDDRVAAAAELYLATMDQKYLDAITEQKDYILQNMAGTAWAVGRVYASITDETFRREMDEAVKQYAVQIEEEMAENPFGVPYKPNIWGDGWSIQNKGFRHYFLVTGFPGVFNPDLIYHATQFVLGCHPGSNTASFASGVGAYSLLQAYGVNKENWSFMWQQTEYVLGGGGTNFMFLVLATNELVK